MKDDKTHRGFDISEFKDTYGSKCSLQKSSIATEDRIWLGVNDANPKVMDKKHGWVDYPIPEEVLLSTRMHLNREQVEELLPYLQRFVETGEITE